jgi:hypothetical protein
VEEAFGGQPGKLKSDPPSKPGKVKAGAAVATAAYARMES